jgi:hypothetical protein
MYALFNELTIICFRLSSSGLCCENGSGSFSVSVDGQRLVSNGGDFDEEDMLTFGSCAEDTPDRL